MGSLLFYFKVKILIFILDGYKNDIVLIGRKKASGLISQKTQSESLLEKPRQWEDNRLSVS